MREPVEIIAWPFGCLMSGAGGLFAFLLLGWLIGAALPAITLFLLLFGTAGSLLGLPLAVSWYREGRHDDALRMLIFLPLIVLFVIYGWSEFLRSSAPHQLLAAVKPLADFAIEFITGRSPGAR